MNGLLKSTREKNLIKNLFLKPKASCVDWNTFPVNKI